LRLEIFILRLLVFVDGACLFSDSLCCAVVSFCGLAAMREYFDYGQDLGTAQELILFLSLSFYNIRFN
jgi:hypothetical protein